MMSERRLSFSTFSKINAQRCRRWHPGFPIDDGWTGADWSNAMVGEAGEAANIVKKLRRLELGTSSANQESREVLVEKLSGEIGDVVTYVDLLAQYYGIDLEDCVRTKFNAISEREGLPERL